MKLTFWEIMLILLVAVGLISFLVMWGSALIKA